MSSRTYQCGSLLDSRGHHCAACADAGGPWEAEVRSGKPGVFSFFSFFHVLYVFHACCRCRALSSRSLGFGFHSPITLVSHVAGLVGIGVCFLVLLSPSPPSCTLHPSLRAFRISLSSLQLSSFTLLYLTIFRSLFLSMLVGSSCPPPLSLNFAESPLLLTFTSSTFRHLRNSTFDLSWTCPACSLAQRHGLSPYVLRPTPGVAGPHSAAHEAVGIPSVPLEGLRGLRTPAWCSEVAAF